MVERSKCMNVPEIRFKGEQLFLKKQLKEIATINPKNALPDFFEYVDLESVVGTEMKKHRTEIKESAPSRAQRLANKGDIFFQTVRPYQQNNLYFDLDAKNFVFSTGYAQIRSKINSKYLFTILQQSNFLNQVLENCTGSSYPAINPSSLANLFLTICDNEVVQQKLASYFQSLDSLIQSTSKKLVSLKQVKAASLQSMFPQEGETVPKVRFKGFKEEWEKEKLCNIASRITRKNKNLESFTPLTISAIEGLVSQLTYFNNIVASSNISGYYLIKNGEFAYNKSYSNGFPYGSIKRLDKFDTGVLSTLYIVFALNKQNTSILSDYLVIFFNTTLWHHEIAKRAEEGARNHGLLNISTEDFLDINIIYPKDLLEQQKIASYFCNLDKQISLQTQRLEKLKQIKAACLDKMFV